MSDLEVGATFDDNRKAQYLNWLLTPEKLRQPRTQAEIAAQIGVSPRTLRDWNQNEEFRKVWKKEQTQLAGSPEKVQMVLDALHEVATDPTNRNMVSAAKEWLDAVGAKQHLQEQATPQKRASLGDIPLEKLVEVAALMATREIAARSNGLPAGVTIEASSR